MTIRFRCKCGRNFEVADTAAGRKARCTDCGLTFLVPSPNAQPPTGQAAAPHAPRPASIRPASPPLSRPAAPGALYALQDEDDDLPMARLAPVRKQPARHAPARQQPAAAHGHSHKPKLIAVQVVAGVSCLVAVIVMIDALVTMLSARRAGSQGVELVYGVAILFAGIGVVVALAAGSGNRFCIGMLMGGAARNVLASPALLFMAISKSELVTSQGRSAAAVWGVAGAFSLIAGVAYFLAPLLSRPVRTYLGASYGAVIGGGVVGLLLGPLVVCTALPSPEMVLARYVTARRAGPGAPDSPAGAAESSVAAVLAAAAAPKAEPEARAAMLEQMAGIHGSLSQYMLMHDNDLPANLGLLVGEGCPEKFFVCPGRGAAAMPRRSLANGYFVTRTDVVYVFQQGRRASQWESLPNSGELIVAYSDPGCGLGDGALVMRLPGKNVTTPVEWLDKVTFDRQLAATQKWLTDNPPLEKPPGLPE